MLVLATAMMTVFHLFPHYEGHVEMIRLPVGASTVSVTNHLPPRLASISEEPFPTHTIEFPNAYFPYWD